MSIPDDVRKKLDALPEDEPRSRLEPFRDVILRWRRQGRTYRRIKSLLAAECSLQVSTTMLFKFVKSRSRPRKQPEAEPEPLATAHPEPPKPIDIPRSVIAEQPASPYTKLTPEEKAEQRALIQALRDKPVVVTEVKKRYTFDPDKSLTKLPPKENS